MNIRATCAAAFLVISCTTSASASWVYTDSAGKKLICVDDPTFLANAISNANAFLDDYTDNPRAVESKLRIRDDGYLSLRWGRFAIIVFDMPENCYYLDTY
jgi:hypothetical protein